MNKNTKDFLILIIAICVFSIIATLILIGFSECHRSLQPETYVVIVTDLDTGDQYESCGMPSTYTDNRGSMTHARFKEQLTESKTENRSQIVIEITSKKGFIFEQTYNVCPTK